MESGPQIIHLIFLTAWIVILYLDHNFIHKQLHFILCPSSKQNEGHQVQHIVQTSQKSPHQDKVCKEVEQCVLFGGFV